MPGIRPGGHPRDAPREANEHPYQNRSKSSILGKLVIRPPVILGMHRGEWKRKRPIRSMQGIGPGGHPRDAPKQKEAQEAHRLMLGIEPSGHPRDASTEAKDAPLPKHGETKHPGSMPGIEPNGHPRDVPKEMDAPLPKHGKRLFIQASLFWQNEYGKNRQCQGKFLVNSGCTGPYSIRSSLWLTSCPGCVGKRLCRTEMPMAPHRGCRVQILDSHCLPVSMRDAVRNFVRMLRESKVWETNGRG
jgi:hypothetical protein